MRTIINFLDVHIFSSGDMRVVARRLVPLGPLEEYEHAVLNWSLIKSDSSLKAMSGHMSCAFVDKTTVVGNGKKNEVSFKRTGNHNIDKGRARLSQNIISE